MQQTLAKFNGMALLHDIRFSDDRIFKRLKKKKEYELQPDYLNHEFALNFHTRREGVAECSGALCGSEGTAEVIFLFISLYLQLWYLPVSLPALRLHRAPAARAPAPCPGLQFP